MSAIPTPPPNAPQRQGTQPPFTVGIAAGAEDVKYQAKYKDLKRKVKEIEADNDKLHFKVLQAKRSIQRIKLERAVLYERLQQVPPSPEMHDRHALPPVHQPQQQHHRAGNNNIRQDPPAHMTRRSSVGGPPGHFMPHIPVPPDPHARQHSSPHMQVHPHPHDLERSPSRSRHPAAQPIYHPQYPDATERSRSSGRRLDISSLQSLPPLSPQSDARGSRGIHNHQRMGPGTYINRADDREAWEAREREWERDTHREQREAVYPRRYEQTQARRRDEQPYQPPPPSRVYSRSNSVGSASGSVSGPADDNMDNSRPASRGRDGAQFYGSGGDRDRDVGDGRRTSFRLRPVAAQPAAEVDFVHEDGRQPPQVTSARESLRESLREERERERERNGGAYAPPEAAPTGGRKRGRNGMDVDDDAEMYAAAAASSSRHDRDRDRDEPRAKRYHPSSDRDRM
ncbi:hypothetical protein B0H12DRAFT_1133105 [Mycena haematopus]|nr:hypothetical protein B0H12DRAFT_1133105 [Mycena haematopus]